MDNNLFKKFEELQEELVEKQKTLQEQFKIMGKPYIKSLFDEAFEEFPKIEKFWWVQYTPHFNDGEPCEFGVHDLYLLLEGDEDSCDYEGTYLNFEWQVDYYSRQVEEHKLYKQDPQQWAAKHGNQWHKKPYGSLEEHEECLAKAKKLLAENPEAPAIKKKLEDITVKLHGIDESLLQFMFGDGVKVTITRGGLDVDDFDHD